MLYFKEKLASKQKKLDDQQKLVDLQSSSVVIPKVAYKKLSFDQKKMEVLNVKRMIACFEDKLSFLAQNNLTVRTDIQKIFEDATKK